MRLIICLFLVSVFQNSRLTSEEKPAEVRALVEQFSREEGCRIAEDLKNNIEWIDLSVVVQGIQDYMSGVQLKGVSSNEGETNFYKIIFQLFELESKNNLQKANDFLQKLSGNAKLHSLEHGKILYEVLTESGATALMVRKNSSPTLHYSISTLNGQEVVNTRNLVSGPFQVPLSETISGFAKGVEGMRLGERRRIFIHPDLGYGQVGQVPPNSLLIVDVEVETLNTI
jgi:peptidylprolyl isomerase